MPDINVGIVEQFIHPPLVLLRPHLDYFGPYSGNVELGEWAYTPGPTFSVRNVSDTFGVMIQLNGSIPAGWGYTNGWVSDDAQYDESTYDPRLAQLVVQHQLLGGAWVTTQMLEVVEFPRAVLWDVALPGRLGLLVAPGLAFDLFYLLVN